MTPAHKIEIGSRDGGLYLSFVNEATRMVCPTADRIVRDYLASRDDDVRITVDLREARWVDSTFAGWLLRIRKLLSQIPGSDICLTGAEGRCHEALRSMRLTALIPERDIPKPAKMAPVTCPAGLKPERSDVELMMRAHEELSRIDESNRHLFEPIARMLRRELDKMPDTRGKN